ncbi:MAG: hypothetical protein ACRD1R_13885 [Acidobacteriota bacterium]
MNSRTHILFLFVLAYTMVFIWPMFSSFFSGDDLMNLFYYYFYGGWQVVTSNVFFWTSYRRPLGGLLYLTLYYTFGMNPLPYYLLAFLIFAANLALLFTLILRLTRNAYLAAVTAALASVHREIIDIWFNFGAVYELLAFGFMMAGFHAYLSFLESPGRSRRWYIWSILFFILALNGKEMAVTFPALLGLYEIIYRIPLREVFSSLPRLALRVSPFAVLALIYTAGKITGQQSYWTENAAYRYHFDSTGYHNLHAYFDRIFFNHIHFDDSTLGWTLGISLGLALLLRNRHMLFGWLFFLTSLLPVIALPRVWGLFLYIPLVGMAFYVAALGFVLGRWVVLRLTNRYVWRLKTRAQWCAFLLFLLMLGFLHYGEFAQGRGELLREGQQRREFSRQLLSLQPELPDRAWLIFEGAPLSGYDLHHLIWLSYGNPKLNVFYGLEDARNLLAAQAVSLPEHHFFQYEDGKLREVPVSSQALRDDSAWAREVFIDHLKAGAAQPLKQFAVPLASGTMTEVQSGVALHNPSPEEASATFTLYDSNGSVLPRMTVSSPIPGTGYLGFIPEVFFQDKDFDWLEFQGSLEVRSSVPVLARAALLGPAGTATFPVTPLEREKKPFSGGGRGQKAYFTLFASGNDNASKFVLINPSSIRKVTATVRMLNNHGDPLQLSISREARNGELSLEIPPRGLRHFIADPRGRWLTGWIEIESDLPLGGVVIFKDRYSKVAALGAAAPRLEFTIPVESSRRSTTALSISNPTSSDITVTLALHERSGRRAVVAATSIQLQARRQWFGFIKDVFWKARITSPRLRGDFEGVLEIRSSEAVAVSAVQLGPGTAVDLAF